VWIIEILKCTLFHVIFIILSMSLNINKRLSDEFYRYKVPMVEIKLIGKGNGKRTILTNIESIAKALNRPILYLMKFLSYYLGTQFRLDKHTKLYILNGSQDQVKLRELIFDFIEKYILCRLCHNPETSLKVNVKRRIIRCFCSACGNYFEISGTDKLGNFILKNHVE